MKTAAPGKILAVEIHMQKTKLTLNQRTVQGVEDGITLVAQSGKIKLGFK